jgi:HK97 family phage major capsid protein
MNLKRFYDAANEAEARVQTIAAQINDLFEKNQNEEALKLKESLDKAKTNATQAHQLYLSMLAATQGDGDPAKRFVPMGGDHEPAAITELRASPEYKLVFFDALRNGVTIKEIKAGRYSSEKYGLLLNALTETGDSGHEGGNLLPIEFDNKIRELMRTFTDLANPAWFNIEDVTAYSGWRAVEQGGPAAPFAAHTENQTMAEAVDPEFSQVTYTIVEYAGYIPVVTNLLSDTPAAIMAYLGRWLAKKAALTNTSIIATLIKAISDTNVTDYTETLKAIKTMLNKTLDPAVSAGAAIFLNQSGLDLLDQLDDGLGRPMLQPDPTLATGFRVKGRPVVTIPTTQFADTDTNTKTQIAIGDGREWLTFFRRMPFEMSATTIGGDAWRFNNTEVRGILRADAKVMDAAAMGLLHITLPT